MVNIKIISIGDWLPSKSYVRQNIYNFKKESCRLGTLLDSASFQLSIHDELYKITLWLFYHKEAEDEKIKIFVYNRMHATIFNLNLLDKTSLTNISEHWFPEFLNYQKGLPGPILLLGHFCDERKDSNLNHITQQEGKLLAQQLTKRYTEKVQVSFSIPYIELPRNNGEFVSEILHNIVKLIKKQS